MERSNLLYIALALLISSCNLKNYERKKTFDEYVKEVKDYYNESNICSHFPEKIEDQSIKQMVLTWPSDAGFSEAYITKDCTEDELLKIEKETSIKGTYSFYDTSNFIMTLDWFWDSTKYTKYTYTDLQLTKLPIPNFELIEFGTEKINYTEKIEGKTVIYTKEKVPEDLAVYVIDAKPGNYWKIDYKNSRPPMLNEWGHGYSKGIAISKSKKIVIYWLMLW